MNMVTEKILHGFLFGIGFTVIAGGAYYVMTTTLYSDMMSGFSFGPKAIEVVEHRKIERDGKLIILGQLKNVSDNAASYVKANVDLFLNGQFVKQCDVSLNGVLHPSESRNFEITCGSNCEESPIVEHDSYSVYVTGL